MSLRDRVVVLDFDGVVWDSVDESFEQAWSAWSESHGLPPYDREQTRKLFREARWQCKDGYDFCIVIELLLQGRTDLGTMPAEEFRGFRETVARGPAAEQFVKRFYETRDHMRTTDFERWCALQGPYPGVIAQIGEMLAEARGVAIATTKDTPSAQALLAHAGIPDLPIYGREISLDKRDHMHAIAAHYGVALDAMCFTEDLLENLMHVANLGVKLALADWGYNTPQERARATAEGIAVVTLDSFARQLRGLWPA